MGRNYVILVHQGMGDCLMALPLIRMCEAQLQEHDRLVLVVRSPFAIEVLQTIELGPKVRIMSPPKSSWQRKLWPLTLLLHLRRLKPAALIAPLVVDSLKNSLWLQLIGATLCVVQKGKWLGRFGRSAAIEPVARRHKTDEFLAYGYRAGFSIGENHGVTPRLTAEVRENVLKQFSWLVTHQRWIVLAPGSGIVEAHKRYPVERFQALARLLLEHSLDIGIVVIGSSNERDLVQSVVDGCSGYPARCFAVAGASMRDALGLLGQAQCVVSGCSGASHLAAAVGTPVVGIYGPTNPGQSGPSSSPLRVVRLGLQCSPCYRMGHITGCGNPICMQLITPETVFQAVLDCLNHAPYPAVPWCETTNATQPAWPGENSQLPAAKAA